MALVTKRFADLRHCTSGLPLSMRNIMKYEFHQQTSAANSWNAYHQFGLNSLNDFDITGTGHQPPLYDTITTVYSRNRVKNAYVDIAFHNDTTRPMRIFFLLTTLSAAPDTSSTADHSNNIGYIGALNLGRADGGDGVVRFRRKIDVDYWLGKLTYQNQGQVYQDLSDVWAQNNANPPLQLRLNVLYEALDYSVTSTLGVSFVVNAKLDTIWANPNPDTFQDED